MAKSKNDNGIRTAGRPKAGRNAPKRGSRVPIYMTPDDKERLDRWSDANGGEGYSTSANVLIRRGLEQDGF